MKKPVSNTYLSGLTCILLLWIPCLSAQTLTVTTPMPAPNWALLEREVLKANTASIEEFCRVYLDERGYLLHTPRNCSLDGPDDAIETFANMTLLPALGASKNIYQLFLKGQEGHLRQYKEVTSVTTKIARNSDYYKDFRRQTDWFHQGEGLRGFFFQPLFDPQDAIFQERIRRFAGFYMNEDPHAPNYDPEVKIIRSIFNGSDGPLIGMATQEDWMGDPVEGRFILNHTSGGEMFDFMENYELMLSHFDGFGNSTGDNPLNLVTTILALNAYMLEHEPKYKDWLLEYVNAWKERIERNGGNIPSNIGLDGSIGGEFGGKWYGGTYGWDFSFWEPAYNKQQYHNNVHHGMWPGFANALLLTGDQRYIDVLRRQMDNLYAEKKVENGQTLIPRQYGIGYDKTRPLKGPLPEGHMWDLEHERGKEPKWYHYVPESYWTPRMTEIYLWSMNRKDLERIPKKGWIGFLEGEEPDYPEQALRRQLSIIRESMEELRNDPTTADTRLADWPAQYNPLEPMMELNRLMQGGYIAAKMYVLHCRVRYFDPAGYRAGLPEDVASLVTGMHEDWTKVTLVNINQVEARDVVLQTGGYGEHQCTRVETGETSLAVNNNHFVVRLEPGAGAELTIYHDRYTNQPTLKFPWHH
ncbi:MAG: hypothetical protein O3C43_05905 [Verrucomicrobia bacterium]|nr:hypothetical protein [Verrucomicrobiota bacterium]MDA1066018.1 hypothetical protein [Verrucomicrobiota bacterium]